MPGYRCKILTTDEDFERSKKFIVAHPEGATMREIAECLGCSRNTVSWIIKKALKKLRWRYLAMERGLDVNHLDNKTEAKHKEGSGE